MEEKNILPIMKKSIANYFEQSNGTENVEREASHAKKVYRNFHLIWRMAIFERFCLYKANEKESKQITRKSVETTRFAHDWLVRAGDNSQKAAKYKKIMFQYIQNNYCHQQIATIIIMIAFWSSREYSFYLSLMINSLKR